MVIPAGQGCCGALSLHSGRGAEAARFAKRTIATFEAANVDAIVVNSAGCGSAMKEYGELLRTAAEGLDGGDWPVRAAQAAAKVRDLSEYLAELAASDEGARGARHPLPVTVAYHDACHLGHAQRIKQQPRDLLRAIPDLRLAELADGGTCCGSAGMYNLLQPEAAGELGARKAARGAGHRRAAGRVGQPGVQPADRVGHGRGRRGAATGRAAHRRGAGRLAARPAGIQPDSRAAATPDGTAAGTQPPE